MKNICFKDSRADVHHAFLTCVIQAKQQGTWYGERQHPHHRNHYCDPSPGTVASVVQHWHCNRCVTVRGEEEKKTKILVGICENMTSFYKRCDKFNKNVFVTSFFSSSLSLGGGQRTWSVQVANDEERVLRGRLCLTGNTLSFNLATLVDLISDLAAITGKCTAFYSVPCIDFCVIQFEGLLTSSQVGEAFKRLLRSGFFHTNTQGKRGWPGNSVTPCLLLWIMQNTAPRCKQLVWRGFSIPKACRKSDGAQCGYKAKKMSVFSKYVWFHWELRYIFFVLWLPYHIFGLGLAAPR